MLASRRKCAALSPSEPFLMSALFPALSFLPGFRASSTFLYCLPLSHLTFLLQPCTERRGSSVKPLQVCLS